MLQSHPVDAPLDRAFLREWPLPSDEDGEKRDRGTVLVVGGSERTPGAVLLAGTAALRIGAGRLQIATAREVTTAVAVAMPEALVVPLDVTVDDPLRELVDEADAVVVGPGLVDIETATELLMMVLNQARPDAVIVIDALAARALPRVRSHVSARPNRLLITVNRQELDFLLDGRQGDVRPERIVAEDYGLTVVSFGCVASPDGRTWTDEVSVLGLGTSGAGDVLAGAAGGAGARCHDAVQAACWAALCHRVAATRLTETVVPIGYLARQVADEIAPALAELARPGDLGASGLDEV